VSDLRLVIFDVDGTLIDSQTHILAAMEAAFGAHDLPAPSRAATLAIVGLSLDVAMARLAPDQPDHWAGLVAAYKDAFATLRRSPAGAALSPLFPGARAALDRLAAEDHTLLAIATGKSRRGMDHILDLHDLRGLFQSVQTADDHPSKPHPAMVAACLRDTGTDARRAVIIGDTSYDIAMGRAAGIHALGVSWGYHPVADLHGAGAHGVIDSFDALPPALAQLCPAS
jgi:phosphoglycolate phosphatase